MCVLGGSKWCGYMKIWFLYYELINDVRIRGYTSILMFVNTERERDEEEESAKGDSAYWKTLSLSFSLC